MAMSQSFKNTNSQSSSSPGKPRIKWIYLVLPLLIILVLLYLRRTDGHEITWHQFETEMLSRKVVEKLVVVNRERVEVYLKTEPGPDSLSKDMVLQGRGPDYFFNIGSVESFERKMDEVQKDVSPGERIMVRCEKKSNWVVDVLSWILPLVGLLILWNFLIICCLWCW
jgi:cell division protease FtsH